MPAGAVAGCPIRMPRWKIQPRRRKGDEKSCFASHACSWFLIILRDEQRKKRNATPDADIMRSKNPRRDPALESIRVQRSETYKG